MAQLRVLGVSQPAWQDTMGVYLAGPVSQKSKRSETEQNERDVRESAS